VKKVRLGFIGCGVHATRDLFPNIPLIPEIELVATCDLKIELAKQNARLFGAKKYYSDFEEMLANEILDAVAIVGPPKMHTEIGLACLGYGLHIFIEKPIAITLEDANKLAKAADKAGKFAQIGHFLRHSDGHQLAKKIIKSKKFGDPILINCKYFTCGPWEPRQEWGLSDLNWTYMIVQGIHLIDLTRYFMGEIKSLNAKRYLSKTGHLSFSVVAQFESKALGLMSFTSLSPSWKSSVEIVGDEGSYIKVENATKLIYDQATIEGNKSNFDESFISRTWDGSTSYKSKPSFGYFGELQHFAKSILLNKQPSPNLWDGYKAMTIASTIIESAKTQCR
tara:strand:+ start:1148 stop:2158 length:1011 start_codon:yes stop_codon:yes gene_type:complete